MQLTEIRIVIYIPEKYRDVLHTAVEKIVEYVKELFPEFKTSAMHSPVRVSIHPLSEAEEQEGFIRQ